MRNLAPCVCLLFVLACAAVADAATYHVAKTGSDGHSCATAQNSTTPKLSLGSALPCLAAGDTLLVKAGTYQESVFNNVASGTAWTNKVRIAAYPGDTVWLKPATGEFVLYLSGHQQYIEFDGINMDAEGVKYAVVKIEGWSGGNPHHIRIKNAELLGSNQAPANSGLHGTQTLVYVTAQVAGIVGGNEFINLRLHRGNSRGGNSAYAFYIQSPNNLVDGCEMYDLSTAGIQLYTAYGYSFSGTVIRNNKIHDITRSLDTRVWGIVVGSGSTGAKIYNNLVYKNGGTGLDGPGILLYAGSSNTEVYNNTVYGNLGGMEGIVVESGVSGSVIQNNISYNNAGGNFRNSGSSTVASYNLIGVNPAFVDASGGNFRLQAGSPGINAGVSVATVATDLAGTARPQGTAYDVGAFELATSQVPVPAAPTGVRIISN